MQLPNFSSYFLFSTHQNLIRWFLFFDRHYGTWYLSVLNVSTKSENQKACYNLLTTESLTFSTEFDRVSATSKRSLCLRSQSPRKGGKFSLTLPRHDDYQGSPVSITRDKFAFCRKTGWRQSRKIQLIPGREETTRWVMNPVTCRSVNALVAQRHWANKHRHPCTKARGSTLSSIYLAVTQSTSI